MERKLADEKTVNQYSGLTAYLLEKQGAGPLFNGAKHSLVDAAYAPFLQRYFFLDRVQPIGLIGQYPRLKAWADTLMKRPTTHSFPEAEFEVLYRLNVKRRKKWLSQFVAEAGGGGGVVSVQICIWIPDFARGARY